MNVLMLYPEFPDTFWSFKHALKFVNKKVANPPLGLATIAAMLPDTWNKRLVDLNVRDISERDFAWADIAFISAMNVQRASTTRIIHRCKQHGLRVVAGGPLFLGEVERFPEVDHFILNEGEITLPEFIREYESGCPRRVYTSERYADMSLSPVPMFELLQLNAYDSMSLQFSRGCPFNCDFCNITAMLGHKPRLKSTRQIIAELDHMYALGWRGNVFFVDDNFIGNKKILKEEVLPALIAWRQGKKGYKFTTEASINMADDPELLSLMAQAGFITVFIGIETPNAAGLEECQKSQNRNRDLLENIHQIQRAGIQVMGGFIVGFDSDTPEIFARQLEFIQQSGICTAMVGLLQAPYGTRLYRRMQTENRLTNEMSGDNADGTSNIVPLMDPYTLHTGYRKLISDLYSPRLFYQRVRTFLKEFQLLKLSARLSWREIAAFFRLIYLIGIVGEGKREFWRFFFDVFLHSPGKLPTALTLAVYGYHFRRVSQLHLHRQPLPKARQVPVVGEISAGRISPARPVANPKAP